MGGTVGSSGPRSRTTPGFLLRGRPYTGLRFTMPGPYRHVRHPLYVGWLFAFWATPTMAAAHLFFAAMTTAYILVAIRYEERDLEAAHGTAYAEYRRRVPMLIPRLNLDPHRSGLPEPGQSEKLA